MLPWWGTRMTVFWQTKRKFCRTLFYWMINETFSGSKEILALGFSKLFSQKLRLLLKVSCCEGHRQCWSVRILSIHLDFSFSPNFRLRWTMLIIFKVYQNKNIIKFECLEKCNFWRILMSFNHWQKIRFIEFYSFEFSLRN